VTTTATTVVPGGKLLVVLAALLLAATLLGRPAGVASAQEGGRCAADAPRSCAVREDAAGRTAQTQEQLAEAWAEADAALAAALARLEELLAQHPGGPPPDGARPAGGVQVDDRRHAQSPFGATTRTA
jgi:hypothetical protein